MQPVKKEKDQKHGQHESQVKKMFLTRRELTTWKLLVTLKRFLWSGGGEKLSGVVPRKNAKTGSRDREYK